MVSGLVTVAHACAHEADDIARLVAEIEQYYGGEVDDNVPARADALRRLLFSDRPVAHVLLARVSGALAGMASYSLLWPAVGDTHSLFLKELFVRDPHRRMGVGRALMRRLEDTARAEKCSRLEWTADRGNTGAKKFYKAVGAVPQSGKIFYRVPAD